ncbi:MAG: hypothetical protein AAB932_00450 [Patescibacteria group bacterium]
MKEREKKLKEADYTIKKEDTECGDEYFVQGTGSQLCRSTTCKKTGEVCVDQKNAQGVRIGSACERGMLGGTITAPNSLLCTDLRKWKIIENKIQLLAMCRNGKIIPIDIIGIAATEDGIASQGGQKYAFPHSGKIRTACKDEGPLDDNLLGFYLGAEINDEGYLTGGFCPGLTGSTGCDDWHAIGKNGAKSHECGVNLAKVAYEILHTGTRPNCDGLSGVADCSCGYISDRDVIVQTAAVSRSFRDHLFTREELEKGFTCNIAITRTEFPALDNSRGYVLCHEDDTDCMENQ